jgi:hypothetical protein
MMTGLSLAVDVNSSARLVDESVLAIAARFIDVDMRRSGATVDNKSTEGLTVDRTGFDRTNGNWVVVRGADMVVKVATDRNEVSWAEYLSEKPDEFAAVDGNGRPVTFDEIRDEVVAVALDEAENEARAFLDAHFGKDVFDGLDLVRNQLVNRGSRVVYVFVWREKTDANGVALGMRSLTVEVNAKTAHVVRFSSSVSEVTRSVDVSADQARTIVLRNLQHLGGVEIHHLALVELKNTDRNGQPVWAVQYSYEGISGGHDGICYVNADTGDVITGVGN